MNGAVVFRGGDAGDEWRAAAPSCPQVRLADEAGRCDATARADAAGEAAAPLLTCTRLEVRVESVAGLSHVQLTSHFANETGRTAEGTFVCPLPPRALPGNVVCTLLLPQGAARTVRLEIMPRVASELLSAGAAERETKSVWLRGAAVARTGLRTLFARVRGEREQSLPNEPLVQVDSLRLPRDPDATSLSALSSAASTASGSQRACSTELPSDPAPPHTAPSNVRWIRLPLGEVPAGQTLVVTSEYFEDISYTRGMVQFRVPLRVPHEMLPPDTTLDDILTVICDVETGTLDHEVHADPSFDVSTVSPTRFSLARTPEQGHQRSSTDIVFSYSVFVTHTEPDTVWPVTMYALGQCDAEEAVGPVDAEGDVELAESACLAAAPLQLQNSRVILLPRSPCPTPESCPDAAGAPPLAEDNSSAFPPMLGHSTGDSPRKSFHVFAVAPPAHALGPARRSLSMSSDSELTDAGAPASVPAPIVFGRTIVFCVPRARAMAGRPLDEVCRALTEVLMSLTPKDSFSIIAYDHEAVPFSHAPVQVSGRTIEHAVKWLSELSARGGTGLHTALLAALDVLDLEPIRGLWDETRAPVSAAPDHPLRYVFFIANGAVDNERTICRFVSSCETDARIFTCGIGPFCNAFFLSMLAEFRRGHSDVALDVRSIRRTIVRLFQRMNKPVLSEIELSLPGKAGAMICVPPPDLTMGWPLHIRACLENPGPLPSQVVVTGVNPHGQQCSVTLPVLPLPRTAGRGADRPPFPDVERMVAGERSQQLASEAWLLASDWMRDCSALIDVENEVLGTHSIGILVASNREEEEEEEEDGEVHAGGAHDGLWRRISAIAAVTAVGATAAVAAVAPQYGNLGATLGSQSVAAAMDSLAGSLPASADVASVVVGGALVGGGTAAASIAAAGTVLNGFESSGSALLDGVDSAILTTIVQRVSEPMAGISGDLGENVLAPLLSLSPEASAFDCFVS